MHPQDRTNPPPPAGSPAAPGPLPSHLRWPGLPQLPPQAEAELTGPGAPFETVTEPVLGHDHQVFPRRPCTLRQMLDSQVASTPDLPFLIAPERQWTYREARDDIDAMAVLLSERYGVGTGDRVAIVAANHAEYAILMWATLTLGAIVTSLNGWWTGPELAYGIGLTSPRLIAGDERRLARLDGGIVPDGARPCRTATSSTSPWSTGSPPRRARWPPRRRR
jgi:hypothetical protein